MMHSICHHLFGTVTASYRVVTTHGRAVTIRFRRSPTIFGFGRLRPPRAPRRTAVAEFARNIALSFILSLTVLPKVSHAQRFATGGPYNTPAGQSPTAELLREVRIEQHLDAPLPLDTAFRDEQGNNVRLGDYFGDKPVVLALVQYRCPMLCTQVLNGFSKASQAIPMEIGRDYQFVAISFDTREGPDLSAEKKKHFAHLYRRPGAAEGMHFLTGDQAAIDAVTQAVGFHYQYVERTDQFAHASGIVMATPQGRLSRYFYGIEYAPHDLRLGLVESSNGAIGTSVDQVLLLCYHYDPLTGKYGLVISTAIRWAGILTIAFVGSFLVAMIRMERRRPKFVRPLIGSTSDLSLPPVLHNLREQP